MRFSEEPVQLEYGDEGSSPRGGVEGPWGGDAPQAVGSVALELRTGAGTGAKQEETVSGWGKR